MYEFGLVSLFGLSGILCDIITYVYYKNENTAYIAHWMGYLNGLLLSLYHSKAYFPSTYKEYIRITALNIYLLLNFILLFDYYHHKYKTTVMNELFTEIEFENCCLEYVKNKTSSCNNVVETALNNIYNWDTKSA